MTKYFKRPIALFMTIFLLFSLAHPLRWQRVTRRLM